MRTPRWTAFLSAIALGPASFAVTTTITTAYAAPLGMLTATVQDLGTLGGESSVATAIDGTIVVGRAQTAKGAWRAFAYDLAHPETGMVNLGTLGGFSTAEAVDGTLVTGQSNVPRHEYHTFVYDLATPAAGMVDLGHRGDISINNTSDVDQGIVVGQRVFGTRTRAFAYDTQQASPHPINLGTVFGHSSGATAIDDGIVVGMSWRVGQDHPFAVDLADPDRSMVDLGPGLLWGRPHDVSGGKIVGGGYGDGLDGAFLYDLGAAAPSMVDLDKGRGEAWAVDGDVAVGSRDRGRAQMVPTVVDLSSSPPRLLGLGALVPRTGGTALDVSGTVLAGWVYTPLGSHALAAEVTDLLAGTGPAEVVDLGVGYDFSTATAVQGDVVVGSGGAGNSEHALVWTLARTQEPVVSITGQSVVVDEGVGAATVTLRRTGDPSADVSVDVATRAITDNGATAGKDYTTVDSTVTFGAGEATATVEIPIVDDGRAEPQESFVVTIDGASGGVVGAPTWAQVDIRQSDQPVDASVRRFDRPRFRGTGVLNLTGMGQTARDSAAPATWTSFYARITNTRPSGSYAGSYVVSAGVAPPGFRVRYLVRGQDVTAAATSPDGYRVALGRGRGAELNVRIRPLAGTPSGSVFKTLICGSSATDGAYADCVRAVVTAAE